MTERNKDIPVAIRVIALDETDGFSLPSNLAPHVKEIHGVYLYDKNQHTHVCEMTPSYCLEFLYHNVVFQDGLFSDDDDEDAEIREEIEELVMSSCDDDVRYEHVRGVDVLEQYFTEKQVPYRFFADDDVMLEEDQDYDEFIEEMKEEFTANHVL